MFKSSKAITSSLIASEILCSVVSFYLLRKVKLLADVEFINDLFENVWFVVFMMTLVLVLALYIFVRINKKLTKERFHYGFGILFAVIGVFIAIGFITILMSSMNVSGEIANLIVLTILYSFPILAFNLGIRIKLDKE